ncbi:hypothetical protein PFISCL1PPCAC_19348, partial [Pristionchus fissidentatus]
SFSRMATTSVARLMRSVDEVLADRDALETFKKWATMDESRCVTAIDLHFAIKQFRKIMEKKPEDGPSIAVLAHKKYISKKTGSCSFLPDSIRSEMSRRAHSIRNSPPSRDFFDPVVPPIDDHLKRIHATFVCSQAFFDLTKEINAALEATPSTSMGTPATIKKERASSLAASCASPSTSSGTMKSSSPFSPFHSATTRTAAFASNPFNPFRTYNIDAVKQEPIDVDAAIASKRAGQDGQLKFADQLGDKLKRLQDEMAKRGVQFARDLSGKGENFDDLTEESVDKDIDDYADRLDARGKNATNKRSASRSPPSLPHTAPPLAPPSHFAYGTNGFAPPPSNRLRRRYMETMHNTTAATGFAPPPQASPTSGTISKKGRPSIDHDSSSSGFFSGLPSSSSSAFSSHFSAPHFNTLRRPTHTPHTPDINQCRSSPFTTLARPSFVTDQTAFSPSPFYNLLTPGASPSHNPERVHNGYATLPRSTSRVPSAPGSSASSGSGKPDGKILLRVTVHGNRPMVFRTEPEQGGMTLKKFRTIFGIGKDRNKFFFKNSCEDDPSDYQWELVSDDMATVPLYHGSITAECKAALDSPE